MAGSPTLQTAAPTGHSLDYGDRFFPRVPKATLDLGVPHNILVDLMLKMTMLEGLTTLSRLSYAMKVPTPICDAVFHHLRQEQFVEVKGMHGNDYELSLTAAGAKSRKTAMPSASMLDPCPCRSTPTRRPCASRPCGTVSTGSI